ncbi:MAG: ADP-ribosylglycohydrolase family protein [Verrucomicrobia bacterium]|jgi:ADP-ribosylglycohydrolase|nr:ADP-ribosylglycohydrolase family protein [Verrucomicrobiota bacterium]|tara:strand:+ start:1046 stop:1993 length:948 start_codon:yes stop_codon:yes gene_type:complete
MKRAYQGSLIADALAMPVHWYYDRETLDRDYPDLSTFQPPQQNHPDSIFWRSNYTALNEKGDILHDQAQFWGIKNIHYHQNLKAGENTVNYKLATALYEQVTTIGRYDSEAWLARYIENMLTPGWHRDTYLEEYHRGFFANYAQGKAPEKCGIKDEHIGGLSQVPALVAAHQGLPHEEIRQAVKTHVALTHRHSNVLRAADCLTRLLLDLNEGIPLREAIMQSAGDWFSTRKALTWESRPDRTVIGQIMSPACYIAEAFPAALYLAWKYHDDFTAAIIANARVGGDSCHRGAVVGSLTALSHPEGLEPWIEARPG